MSETRKIIALTAPSGAGKTTIARRVLATFPEMTFSVSATTRARRLDEKHGVQYYFVSEDAFRDLIASGALIEYQEVYPGRFYGTLRSEVEQKAATTPILLDIDVEGTLKVKRLYSDDALTIFIQPPSLEVLAERAPEIILDTFLDPARGAEAEESVRRYWRRFGWVQRAEPFPPSAAVLPAPDLSEGARLLRARIHPELESP